MVALFLCDPVGVRDPRGLQNKVLEAMALAKPAVISPRAADGIAGRHGHEFPIAETAEDTAGAVSRLLGDPIERERLGWTARQFVAANHSWKDEMARFELIVAGMIRRSAPRQHVTAPATASGHPRTAGILPAVGSPSRGLGMRQ